MTSLDEHSERSLQEDAELDPKKKRKEKSARVKAMDYLARRDHSEEELTEKLSKNYKLPEIQETLQELKERGWILPPHELSEKVTKELNQKHKGYLFICSFLHKKGLPTLPKDDELEMEKARRVATAKLKDPTDSKRLAALLKNRGFDTETIGRLIHEIRNGSYLD